MAAVPRTPAPRVVFTQPQDSWKWVRVDVPARLAPLLAAPLLFLWLGRTPSALGLLAPHPLRDLARGILFGLIGFGIAAVYAEWLQRQSAARVVPNAADLGLQTAYYVLLNAPIEELFFRGLLQNGLALWWQAPVGAFVVATAIFTAYHLLGRWSWEATLGAGVSGVALGLLFLVQDPPSLLLPVTVHAFITPGFLSLGPWLWWRLGLKRITRP